MRDLRQAIGRTHGLVDLSCVEPGQMARVAHGVPDAQRTLVVLHVGLTNDACERKTLVTRVREGKKRLLTS